MSALKWPMRLLPFLINMLPPFLTNLPALCCMTSCVESNHHPQAPHAIAVCLNSNLKSFEAVVPKAPPIWLSKGDSTATLGLSSTTPDEDALEEQSKGQHHPSEQPLSSSIESNMLARTKNFTWLISSFRQAAHSLRLAAERRRRVPVILQYDKQLTNAPCA